MVPNSHSTRISELLDTIRADFDQLTQEAYICRNQRDEYESKLAHQIKEMHKFQQGILDLERNQQKVKKQYEEEIARLRQQLEQQQQPQKRTSQSNPEQQPPPNIGGTSHFTGIINTNNSTYKTSYNQLIQHVIKQSTANPQSVSSITLTDIDPSTVPDHMKVEGADWFVLFNPTIPRSLKINLIHSFDHKSVVCCVKFSMDGRYLAAGCNRYTYIYDVASSQKICTLYDETISQENDLYVRSVSFSPDSRLIATGAEDKQIRIWDIQTRRIRNTLHGHEQDIYSLEFSRDGRILVSGSGDRTTRVWDMADGTCQHVLHVTDAGQKDPGVTSVALSHDGRLVATGSLDKMVRIWDTHTGLLMEQLEGHHDSVYSVAFMPNSTELISGSLDKTIKLWKLGTRFGPNNSDKNPCKRTFTGHKDFVLSIACCFDGKWIVSGSKDRTIQFWDPNTGQPHMMLQGHKNSVISVAVAMDGRPLFASGSGDNTARIWSYS
ncbi:WD40-repeat-containing domain protein [Cokeromyces recurvatus]|uniref:WD40-repeat-containing domain protein n=1 Tax=Cokeromyces recurvatus TaxID=90255 RepID=UPI00221E8EB6|nr:WD40-repeat-containing domain protein [Cokeromyces recurvatus]KAI7902293.1 WD40-repeat-containing domain protein [Cokeromyces recurvatus]